MPSQDPFPLPQDLREASLTLTGLPKPGDPLARRLEFVADLLAAASAIPKEPLLLWRESGGPPRHVVIAQELVVGRSKRITGLALPDDSGLSRQHFLVRQTAGQCVLEDLQSHNGTAINHPGQHVRQHLLRDGDLILAGKHVFVFLDCGRQQ